MKRIQVIDSHTGGEPTRIIIAGGPDLGTGPIKERMNRFRDQSDDLRRAVIKEPRGSDVLVGGLICEPTDPSCVAGVIYFNTAGFLGMCGHGTIGLMVTLQHLGRADIGYHKLETPVGLVGAEIRADGKVAIQNVPSYRYQTDVIVDVPGLGPVTGDVAWGGNWFFLAKDAAKRLVVENTRHLTGVALKIRDALHDQAVTGINEAYIDHIELFGPPVDTRNDSRNFVLCPGGAYDRSPCGTGTSAKLACLAADGKLAPGEIWRQESIVGSVFECSYEVAEAGSVIPTITGSAYICAEATLLLDPNDPFCTGIR